MRNTAAMKLLFTSSIKAAVIKFTRQAMLLIHMMLQTCWQLLIAEMPMAKDLPARAASVRAKELLHQCKKKIENKKEITESVKAGYIFRNGETLRDNVIVLVPKGEKPQIQCSVK